MIHKTRWHKFINWSCKIIKPIFRYEEDLDRQFNYELKKHAANEMETFIDKMGVAFEQSLEHQDLIPFTTVPLDEKFIKGKLPESIPLNTLRAMSPHDFKIMRKVSGYHKY